MHKYIHSRLNMVDEGFDVNVIYPESTSKDVIIYRTKKSNIPNNIETVHESLMDIYTKFDETNTKIDDKVTALDGDKVSGILPTSKGGTGRNSNTSNSILVGNGSSTIKNIASGNGAFYATSSGAEPKFGILPTAQGGTGNASGTVAKLTTARTITTKLDSTDSASFDGSSNITPGVSGLLPITNGGTGSSTDSGARTNLGLSTAFTAVAISDKDITFTKADGTTTKITTKDTTYTFTDSNPTLSWGTKSKVATVGGTDIHVTMPANPNTNTTYTFAKGSTNGAFTVTPSGGSAQTVAICGLDSASNGRTYLGLSTAFTAASISGKEITFTKADGTTQKIDVSYAVTSKTAAGLCPALPNETTTTKYLRQDGTWQVPYTFTDSNPTLAWGTKSKVATVGGTDIHVTMPANPNTNTTYTFGNGTTNGTFKVTPSGGSVQEVKIGGLKELAYKDSLTKSDVGLSNVDNTADANKNVATAVSATTASYATKAFSQHFYGGYWNSSDPTSDYYNANYHGPMLRNDSNFSNMVGLDLELKLGGVTPYVAHSIHLQNEGIELDTREGTSLAASFQLMHIADVSKNTYYGNAVTQIYNPLSGECRGYTRFYLEAADHNALNYWIGCYAMDVKHPIQGTYAPIFASAFHESSSIRFKKDVKDITEEDAKKILKLRPVSFVFKESNEPGKGFIAEEAIKVDDTQVSKKYDSETKKEEITSINYSGYIAQIVKLLQIQNTEIENLQMQNTEIEKLKKEIENLKKEIEDLKK